MKKHTKFISLVLAVMLAVSTFAGIAVFPTSAADDEQIIYFRFPDENVWTHDGLKINSRSGLANVYCYAYAIYGNTHKYALGWKTRKTQCTAVDEGAGLVDSTLFSFNLAKSDVAPEGGIEEGADYGVIFSTAAAGQNQTCDLNLSTECLGDTVIVTPFNGEVDRENAADSHKRDHYAAWQNHTDPYGPKATISSLGALMPGYFPANQPHAQQLSNALKQYLTNPTNNPYFQYANNMVLCQALEVTPQQVYDQYMKDNADYISGEAETDAKVPCPFYRYMYENDQLDIVEGKLAAPDYVKEVLGITDEEPTTEEPTEEPTTEEPTTEEPTTEEPTTEAPTDPTPIDKVTVYTDQTIAVGYPVPYSQQFYYTDDNYGIGNVNFIPTGDFAYGTTYTLTFDVEAMEGFALTADTEVELVTNDDSVTPVASTVLNDDGTITATYVFTMPEEPTTEEPTTEEPTTEEPTTEPVVADTFTVAGSSTAIFNGASWDASATANDMTFNEATGLYEITYPDAQPEDAIQLKVVKNHAWDESYPEDNYTFNVKEACDVTVTFNPETGEVNVTGDGVNQDTDLVVEHVIAVGNGEDTYLNGANWDPCDTSNELMKIADGIYEITLEDIYAFDNYNIKFAVNSIDKDGNPTSNPWAHNFGSEEEKAYETGVELDAFYNGKNCIFEVEEDGSTVKLQLDLRNFDFATKQGAKMTVTVIAPEPDEPTTAEPTTEEPTTEEPTTEEPTTEEPTTEEPTTEEPTTEEPTTEEPTTEEPTTEEPTTEEPTTEEPTTEPVVADTYTVAGSSTAIFNGASWDASATANDMTFNEATGLYEITYPDAQPEDAIQLKVVKNHAWDESYPEDNYTFNVKEACDVTVTFNPETGEVNVTGDGVNQDTDLVVEHVIAVGNGEDTYLNGANWDPCDTSNELTKVSDGIYEITLEDIYAFDNYNIKFAVNSIDKDGNPTSNPWAHNFGSEEEKTYETGVELDAFYNGKNCIFEVEEDGSTVKLQLDLRNFDFATKQGAKMTITVTAPEPQTEGIIGDVNGDGVVTISDATAIQKYSIELPVEGTFNNKLADVNNDGVITVLDASCVQRYAAEMTKKTGNAGMAYEDITPVNPNPDIVR